MSRKLVGLGEAISIRTPSCRPCDLRAACAARLRYENMPLHLEWMHALVKTRRSLARSRVKFALLLEKPVGLWHSRTIEHSAKRQRG